jgi:hypothetical protein
MKNLILIASLFLCSFTASFAQTKTVQQGNTLVQVVVPVTLESLTSTSKKTELSYVNSMGESFDVYLSENGKYFYVKKSKSGNFYKVYLTIEK